MKGRIGIIPKSCGYAKICDNPKTIRIIDVRNDSVFKRKNCELNLILKEKEL